mmetsp:Transcript_19201/g.57933  ORF Transcript_19201/g.57933 Transcript_19201/m.57933 type:complete len:203 (-) Transcript_19201:597-1205(-)|eukprot:CAMPEP_0206145148 /NCGR_PEP_ID=MMETSP1473-20131121/26472_1 /ASSEMBLY_ACC=CAM_ASM_001109 /TAXON_ID=1461547 /ORGANISM="Stichococcus sp, Strain RCC1054" /LENGTH=202 /DNA_ID=CAMNT_0053541235 /DNA_START=91 /DNA_END=699 /DNA_ORIENTATION=+
MTAVSLAIRPGLSVRTLQSARPATALTVRRTIISNVHKNAIHSEARPPLQLSSNSPYFAGVQKLALTLGVTLGIVASVALHPASSLTLGAINPGAILPGNGKVSLESVMPKIMSDEGPKAVKEAGPRKFQQGTVPGFYGSRSKKAHAAAEMLDVNEVIKSVTTPPKKWAAAIPDRDEGPNDGPILNDKTAIGQIDTMFYRSS